jgi:hypothetical protein
MQLISHHANFVLSRYDADMLHLDKEKVRSKGIHTEDVKGDENIWKSFENIFLGPLREQNYIPKPKKGKKKQHSKFMGYTDEVFMGTVFHEENNQDMFQVGGGYCDTIVSFFNKSNPGDRHPDLHNGQLQKNRESCNSRKNKNTNLVTWIMNTIRNFYPTKSFKNRQYYPLFFRKVYNFDYDQWKAWIDENYSVKGTELEISIDLSNNIEYVDLEGEKWNPRFSNLVSNYADITMELKYAALMLVDVHILIDNLFNMIRDNGNRANELITSVRAYAKNKYKVDSTIRNNSKKDPGEIISSRDYQCGLAGVLRNVAVYKSMIDHMKMDHKILNIKLNILMQLQLQLSEENINKDLIKDKLGDVNETSYNNVFLRHFNFCEEVIRGLYGTDDVPIDPDSMEGVLKTDEEIITKLEAFWNEKMEFNLSDENEVWWKTMTSDNKWNLTELNKIEDEFDDLILFDEDMSDEINEHSGNVLVRKKFFLIKEIKPLHLKVSELSENLIFPEESDE